MKVLRLERGVGSDPHSVAIERNGKAITAFKPAGVALALETRRELVAECGAARAEPVVGERNRAGEVGRPLMAHAMDAGHERIAPAGAEPLRQIPVGTGAGARETKNRIRRVMIIHTGRIAECAGGHSVRTDRRIAIRRSAAAEAWSPGGPTLIVRSRRRSLEYPRIG